MSIKKINIKLNSVITLILFSLFSRLVLVYFVRDFSLDHEWKILLDNLISYKSYSYYSFNSELIPSVYMPPLYPFLLYFLSIITFFDKENLLYLTILLQILLSTYSVYLFYELNKNFFSQKISLINSFIFSIIPLNIYAVGQISSINLQVFLSLLFLNLLFKITNNQTNKNLFYFSIISALLILTRGEFLLIFAFLLAFITFKKRVKLINFFKILIIVLLIISPYVIRNYIHFDQIFLVKSLGYNLWKGNNELSGVGGYENLDQPEFKELSSKLDNIEKDINYEIKRDNIFLKEAIFNLNNKPIYYLKLSIKKFFSYYFIDLNSNYPNYYNPYHVLPIFLLSLLSIPGLFILIRTKVFEHKCLGLYLFSNLAIFSIFFILPRYKLIIIPIQVILVSYFFIYIFKKIIQPNKQ